MSDENSTSPKIKGRRKKKRAKKAPGSTKAATRSTTSNAKAIKLIEQATDAIRRANKFLGKIKI